MLNNTKIKSIKPQAKRFRVADGHGLAIEFKPNGCKYWRFRYNFEGKSSMISLGANACSMGRPYLYGLAAAGQEGVEAVLSIFEAELKRNMMLMGINKLSQLDHSKIRRR
jgi:hypothetical protein